MVKCFGRRMLRPDLVGNENEKSKSVIFFILMLSSVLSYGKSTLRNQQSSHQTFFKNLACRKKESPKSRSGEGWAELRIAPRCRTPSSETLHQLTLIRALCNREQMASPPSPENSRALRALGVDRDSVPASRQPRARAALADPLVGARP